MATTARPLDRHAASEPAAVGMWRRRVRRWRAGLSDDADTVDDLVDDLALAVSEALENVVDHAFADVDNPGNIVVHAHQTGRTVTISIADDGHRQPIPVDHGHRGRGLSLIDQLAETSTVATGSTGTTVTLVHTVR